MITNLNLNTYKLYLIPVLTVVIVLGLSLTLGRFVLGQILTIREELAVYENKNEVLRAKSELLSTFQIDQYSPQASASLAAIPSHLPSLPALSTLRSLANKHNIYLTDFRLEERDNKQSQVKELLISINASGSIFALLPFISEVQEYKPLMRVTKVNLSGSSLQSSVILNLTSIWSPLPASVGKVDDPIENLTASEAEALRRLTDLKELPGTQITPGVSAGKTNPFD